MYNAETSEMFSIKRMNGSWHLDAVMWLEWISLSEEKHHK